MKFTEDIILSKMNQGINNILHAIDGLCSLPQWYLQRFNKRDKNLWIFDSWCGERYSDNPRALYEYVLVNEPTIRPVWITKSEAIYTRLKNEGKPVAMCYSAEGRKIQKRAGVFFCTHGRLNGESEGELKYMNGIRYVNLWHGAPLKQVGDDEEHFKVKHVSWWKKVKTSLRKILVPWEFLHGEMINSSPFFAPYLQSAFGRMFKMIDFAEPRLDKLVQPVKESLIKAIDLQYNSPTKVLYMPTFRDTQFGRFSPFEQVGFNAERLESILESQNIVFLYKGHYLDKENGVGNKSERIRVICDEDYDDLYSFIKDVDVLITDYSSIYFDFLCLGKPIILFPFDYKEYTSGSRGFYFDYNLLEAKRVYTWSELEQCLLQKSYYSPSKEEIRRFRPNPIGNCSKQLVDYLKQ